MRFGRWAAVAVVVVLLAASAFVTRPTNAKDAPGCDGLGNYRKEMFKAGRDYLAALDKDGIPVSRDPLTYSTDDWTALADNALDFQRALKKITPPDWAKDWHQLQIQRAGVAEQIGRTAAKEGIFAAVAIAQGADQIDRQIDAITEQIGKTCIDFPTFRHDWDALDGDIDGTPVATPTD